MSRKQLDDLENRISALESNKKIEELERKIQSLETDIVKKLQNNENKLNRGITVYRQYFTYRLKNARVMEVTAKFYMWVPANSDVWVYGLPGYLPSLSAKTGDGTELPTLGDHELNLLFTNEEANFVSQQSLRELYYEQIGIIEPERRNEHENDLHFVGLIIPQFEFDHFQEIVLRWTEQIKTEHLEEEGFSYFVKRRHVVEPTTEASTYVNITMDAKKYQIIGEPKISAYDAENKPVEIIDGEQYRKILSDKTQYVYRIRRHSPLTFSIEWMIGIPVFVKRWAVAGFAISVPVIFYSIISFCLNPKLVDENSRLLAGIIAMLVGFRVLLFHDTELMSKWNSLYLILLGISAFVIILTQWIAKFYII